MTKHNDPEFHRVLTEARRVIYNCGPNVNDADRAYTLISVCIDKGRNTKLGMLQIAKCLGLNTQQVAAVLDSRAGRSPNLHDWSVDEDGRYWLHQQ